MKKTVLLKLFKEAHPRLMALSPKIIIDEITESSSSDTPEIISYNPPLFEITVKHPFIFDNRLVPNAFNGIKVNNITMGVPFEFKPSNDTTPLFEVEDPKKYESFVENNLSLIRKKLKSPSMNKQEALDALTVDFIEHVEWYNSNKEEFLNTYHWKDGTWTAMSRVERLKKLTEQHQQEKKNGENGSKPFLIQNHCFGRMLPGVE